MQPTRPVMDIRPQRPTPTPSPRPTFSPATMPAAPVEPAPPPAPVTTPAMAEEHHEVHPTPTAFPAELPKAKTPKAAIAIAVIVGASLIGLAIFGYLKSQDKTETATKPGNTQSVTAEDVDDSLTETDDALGSLDDTADFNATDLSDDSLGL